MSVIVFYVLNCCSSIMDGNNSCQDLFTDMDYMSCPNCIALQQVINYNYLLVLMLLPSSRQHLSNYDCLED